MPTKEALLEQVKTLHWAHTIDLGDGAVTPGYWPASDFIRRALDQVDFRGKKVLDVGCWDGLWSFEAEKRGAALVWATDDRSQRPWRDQPTVELARQLLQSRVRYFPDVPVFDVPKLGIADFDVVLFFGVYYHLKDPLLALSRLRQVMKTGAVLLVEGEVIHGSQECFARFCYRQHHSGDPSNWWVPTVPCLRQWIECSYFEVEAEADIAAGPPAGGFWAQLRRSVKRLLRPRTTFSRHIVRARAVERRDPNYLFPDAELSRFAP